MPTPPWVRLKGCVILTAMSMELTFLGTGTSVGIPMIGCHCPVCSSANPRNIRRRTSLYVKTEKVALVIDTPPDFRQQMLRNPISTLDAVLFTHKHADHVHGLDDVRVYSDAQGPIDCYAAPETAAKLRMSFSYIFEAGNRIDGIPKLLLHEIDSPFQLFGRTIVPVPLMHGKERILGYRIGNFAYLTDCSGVPDESLDLLGGLEILVIDGLRFRPHPHPRPHPPPRRF